MTPCQKSYHPHLLLPFLYPWTLPISSNFYYRNDHLNEKTVTIVFRVTKKTTQGFWWGIMDWCDGQFLTLMYLNILRLFLVHLSTFIKLLPKLISWEKNLSFSIQRKTLSDRVLIGSSILFISPLKSLTRWYFVAENPCPIKKKRIAQPQFIMFVSPCLSMTEPFIVYFVLLFIH